MAAAVVMALLEAPVKVATGTTHRGRINIPSRGSTGQYDHPKFLANRSQSTTIPDSQKPVTVYMVIMLTRYVNLTASVSVVGEVADELAI